MTPSDRETPTYGQAMGERFWGALVVAAIVAALNAVIPPVLAALRLPLELQADRDAAVATESRQH